MRKRITPRGGGTNDQNKKVKNTPEVDEVLLGGGGNLFAPGSRLQADMKGVEVIWYHMTTA